MDYPICLPKAKSSVKKCQTHLDLHHAETRGATETDCCAVCCSKAVDTVGYADSGFRLPMVYPEISTETCR